MKLFLLLSLLVSTAAFTAETAKDCREAIVEAKLVLGQAIEKDSFSSNQFSDFNISISEFNEMSPEEQSNIYVQVKPLSIMVEEVRAEINSNIGYIQDSPYAFFYVDELAILRETRDVLIACILE